MVKKILVLSLMVPIHVAQAGLYLDTSIGGSFRMLDGESKSYKSSPAAQGQLALGAKGERWDFSIDGTVFASRQKEMEFSYEGQTLKDDFNRIGFHIGPTVKYHIPSGASGASWAPFLGLHYASDSFLNSKDLRDETRNRNVDNDHELWGYGGKIGVQYLPAKRENSYLDAIHYQFYAAYTRYRGLEADYKNGPDVFEYDSDESDKLSDLSVGILIGMRFGDNLWQKGKQLFSR